LQNWGGIPHPKGMIAEKLPEVRHFFFLLLLLSEMSSGEIGSRKKQS
jgi:hypothetical protein